MNPFQGLLHLLSDPNIAFILFTLGILGLLFEVAAIPNFVTGILGALAMILAFIGFGSLPLNIAGLMLIVLGIVLFVLEATVTSHGLLAIGGMVCFVLGASALYTTPATRPSRRQRSPWPVIVVTTALTGSLMVLDRRAPRSGRGAWRPPNVGVVGNPRAAGHGGAIVEVRRRWSRSEPSMLAGEEWSARTAPIHGRCRADAGPAGRLGRPHGHRGAHRGAGGAGRRTGRGHALPGEHALARDNPYRRDDVVRRGPVVAGGIHGARGRAGHPRVRAHRRVHHPVPVGAGGATSTSSMVVFRLGKTNEASSRARASCS